MCCVLFRPPMLSPSPKSHCHEVGLPVEASANRTERPPTWKVNSATGGAEGPTIGRLSRPTLTPTCARTFAVPGAAPGKSCTCVAPPASGLLTSWTGLPEESVPKLPRLVLSTTSVPSAAMLPSLLRALTVSVAPCTEPASSWPRSEVTTTTRSVEPVPGVSGAFGATGLPESQAPARSPSTVMIKRTVRRIAAPSTFGRGRDHGRENAFLLFQLRGRRCRLVAACVPAHQHHVEHDSVLSYRRHDGFVTARRQL